MPVRQHELQHKKLWNGRRTGSPSDLFEPLNEAHGKNDRPNSEVSCTLE